jgi:hypothetical protein
MPSLNFAQAAAVPVAALTAFQSLFHAEKGGMIPGRKVLISIPSAMSGPIPCSTGFRKQFSNTTLRRVGLMFSLGHSTIVLVGSAFITQTAPLTNDWFSAIRSLGSLAGTLISAFFLFAIAIVNIIVLRTVYQEVQESAPGRSRRDPGR